MYPHMLVYMQGQRNEVKNMSPRTGRPTSDPKNLNTRIRLSENDINKLEFCCEKLKQKKSEIIRLGIEKVYNELKK